MSPGQKVCVFQGIQILIQFSPQLAIEPQSEPFNSTPHCHDLFILKLVFTLSSYLRIGSLNGLLPSGFFPCQIILCNFCFVMGAKYRAQLILLDFISLIILGDK